MSKRDLFVFAGQSNMMGAATLPPTHSIAVKDSYEYKHKAKRLGQKGQGDFVPAGYPCGEFSYTDSHLEEAYAAENVDDMGNSRLNNYKGSTYFVPALCNIKDRETRETYPFSFFSESSANNGPSMAPLFAEEWEALGQKCAYAHIAKGAVSILYYFNRDMLAELNKKAVSFNETHGEKIPLVNENSKMCHGASAYFDTKVRDFFADAALQFPHDDLSEKIFVWCQGEGDRATPVEQYQFRLDILWEHMRALGFTKFFCVRIGNWGGGKKQDVMFAQEKFCRENENCYMVTRAMSLMPNAEADPEGWFISPPDKMYEGCRDLYYRNPHVNEKGFMVVAKRLAQNSYRILREQQAPILEDELVSALVSSEEK